MRKTAWAVMTVLATLVATYAVVLLAVPLARPPFLRDRFATIPVAAWAHLAGAAVALAAGAFQHNARLRARYLNAHRWTGRTYVVGVLVGGLGALALAPVSQGGLPAHVGFGMLGVLWLGSTGMAWLEIRAGNQASHRRWMTRSYSLTLAAVTLRLYLPASIVLGIPFEPAYQTIAWLCWVPNLVVAEWLILRRDVAPTPRTPPAVAT